MQAGWPEASGQGHEVAQEMQSESPGRAQKGRSDFMQRPNLHQHVACHPVLINLNAGFLISTPPPGAHRHLVSSPSGRGTRPPRLLGVGGRGHWGRGEGHRGSA